MLPDGAAVKLGKIDFWSKPGYEVFAVFSDVGGLKNGSPVVVAGVAIGR